MRIVATPLAFGPLALGSLLVVIPQGCGDDGAATADASTGGAESTRGPSTTSATADSSASGADTTTAGVGSSESGYEAPTSECGNGYVDVDEDCDDGNDDPLDACPNDCRFACGVEWEFIRSAPTLESDLQGIAIATDAGGNVYAIAYLRQIDVDLEGEVTLGEVTTQVVALDGQGTERWARVLAADGVAVRPGAVAVDDGGAPYVALTREVEAGGTDVQVLRLDAADGATVWTHDVVSPVVDGNDQAVGLAAAADGSVVVTASVVVAQGDDDVWTRKLDATDGTERWTSSFDGPSTGMFSTDNAGPVAIGPDGTIAVLAQAYVDFSASPATLLVYAEDGGDPLWTWSPPDDGGSQELNPAGVEIDGDGNVYAAYQRVLPDLTFWVAKLDADGVEQWRWDGDHFLGEDNGWSISGLGLGPAGPSLAGSYNNGDSGDAWAEAWVAQVDPDADPLCLFTFAAEGVGVLVPDLLTVEATVGPSGAIAVIGQRLDEGEEALWIAQFRAFGR